VLPHGHGQLARTRKGIILFHDIQPSTAKALPSLLADLKAKGYRIVHLVPKAPLGHRVRIRSHRAERCREEDRGRRRAAQALGHVVGATAAGAGGLSGKRRRPDPDDAGQKPADPATPTRAPRRGGAAEEDWKAGLWRSY
jgi:hypothetical protein